MAKLDSLKEVGSRIRWKSILAVLFVILVVILVFRNLQSGYVVKDNIGLRAYAEPGSTKVGGSTILQIEVKNLGQDQDVGVAVTARAYDERFVFTNTSSTLVEAGVRVGPKEVRRLSYEMKLLSPLEGTYGVEVTAKAENKIEGVKEQVYVNVER
ncbi:MAG: hypothetical protein FJY77_02295 [Candidatus Altiarchaeales archaeon]|nr:hypothetical protein [Candidatus Altiarchaeales archaeon]